MSSLLDFFYEFNKQIDIEQHNRYSKEVYEVLDELREFLLLVPVQIILAGVVGLTTGIILRLIIPFWATLLVVFPILLFPKEFEVAFALITLTMFNIVTNIPNYLVDITDYLGGLFDSCTENRFKKEESVDTDVDESDTIYEENFAQ